MVREETPLRLTDNGCTDIKTFSKRQRLKRCGDPFTGDKRFGRA